jgi:hypothetical protein
MTGHLHRGLLTRSISKQPRPLHEAGPSGSWIAETQPPETLPQVGSPTRLESSAGILFAYRYDRPVSTGSASER